MPPTHQVAITIVAPVRRGATAALEAALRPLADDPAGNALIPFAALDGLHFARMVVVPAAVPEEVDQLALMLDCDAPEGARLRQLVTRGAAGLDAVFAHCEGYPEAGARTGRDRLAYLRRQRMPAGAVYVNTIGRTFEQICAEAALREAIEAFLDAEPDGWQGRSATDVRRAIRRFVSARGDLRWALQPPPPPPLLWRAGETAHFGLAILAAAAAAPVALVAAPALAVALRRREKRDPAPRLLPSDAHVRALADAEDRFSQNQFTAIGTVKPGRFRQYLARAVLWGVNVATRHVFNRSNLTGVRTIHAARWVFLDDHRRLIFASNYDGSLENYMDDFIDKVAWGLNAVFSNGVGYPRTNWLIRDGAKDELAFKSYIRTHQQATDVWYTAYGNLTTLNIENNARIRAGLRGAMDEPAAAAWLRRF